VRAADHAAASAADRQHQTHTLEPTSKWVLNYADERCSLLRNFGNGDDAVLLQIDSYGSWNTFRVTLSGTAVPRSNHPAGTGSFRFSSDVSEREAALLQGTLGEKGVAAASLSMHFSPGPEIKQEEFDKLGTEEKARMEVALDRPRPEFDDAVETISVTFPRGRSVELHVQGMAEPLKAMRTCVDDLYRSWGIEPSAQKSLSAAAVPLPKTVKHVQSDYPPQKLREGQSAYVPVRMTVSEDGKASSCVVQSSAVDEDFKHAVCANLQGDFAPARNASGAAIQSLYNTSVVYLIR